MAQLKSMFLILTAIFLLTIPGVLYNNLNNNGLVVSQSQALTCSTDAQTPTCQISGNVGCQSNTNYCNLSGRSISFLNINSPFTWIFGGNPFALTNNLNSNNVTNSQNIQSGPFDYAGGGIYYTANCFVDSGLYGTFLTEINFFHGCTETSPDGANLTIANTATWENWNKAYVNNFSAIHFFNLNTNSTWSWSCAGNPRQGSTGVYLRQLNYSTTNPQNGWTWYGCDYEKKPVGLTTRPDYALLLAVPNTNGVLVAGHSHINVYVKLVNWPADICGVLVGNPANNIYRNLFYSTQCVSFVNNVLQTALNQAVNSVNQILSFGYLTPLLTFLIGVFLFLAGLELNFSITGSALGTGGGVGAGVGEQGARLCQMLGFGLIVFVPLYSEFATWFTSGLLPYGLDGGTGIVSIFITGIFFFGLFWRVLSLD